LFLPGGGAPKRPWKPQTTGALLFFKSWSPVAKVGYDLGWEGGAETGTKAKTGFQLVGGGEPFFFQLAGCRKIFFTGGGGGGGGWGDGTNTWGGGGGGRVWWGKHPLPRVAGPHGPACFLSAQRGGGKGANCPQGSMNGRGGGKTGPNGGGGEGGGGKLWGGCYVGEHPPGPFHAPCWI